MKRLLLILFVIGSAGACAAFDGMFAQGQAAYDEGRYDEAIECYETMLSNGVVNAEVHYNLANALFRAGHLPPAIWHYRTAWYTVPRDPDINANLHFALNAAGAVETTPTFIGRTATSLSSREWLMAAVATYLVLAALLMLALLISRARQSLLKLCIVPAAGLLIAAGGWWHWQTFRTQPEAVVRNSGVTALFGPVEGSTAHYKLPAGALVRQTASDPKGWVEVEYDNKQGWVRAGDILTLSP
jgi:tetratricopeptide (TPR) repeat protein